MPTYEYRCPDGHVFEIFKSINAANPDKCPVCGKGPLEVVLHPVAVHFKGSGFYSTDYGRGGGRRKGESSKDGDSGSSDKGNKSDKSDKAEKKDTGKSETKAAEA